MNLWFFFTLLLIVEADLLDLYVQHMDETMGTYSVQKNRHPFKRTPAKFRAKRSPNVNLKIGGQMDPNQNRTPGMVGPVPKKCKTLNYDQVIEELKRRAKMTDVISKLRTFKKRSNIMDVKELNHKKHGNKYQVEAPEVKLSTSVNVNSNYSNIEKVMKRSERRKDHLRFARSVIKGVNFTRHEYLDDNGLVLLEWDPSDYETVTFRVTAKTLGYIGIGFNDKVHMKGADILLAWVEDHSGDVRILDSHGDEETNASPITDSSQDVDVLEGFQNDTHTSVTFSRLWQTCDPDDRHLTEDNVRVLWAMHDTDPELNTAIWHGEKRGGRALRLRAPAPVPSPELTPDIRHWDVKLNQYAIDEKQDTIYWCKIFKAPPYNKKHHMIGYEPVVEKGNEALVHHMILYECASTSPVLGQHARIVGNLCHSPTMPREWDSCIQPVVAWARGSRGEWFADHVGIPVAEHKEGSYYMLEVHYNNPMKKKAVDSSGLRLYLTPNLRPQEAGIFVTGVAVTPLHLIPPKQKEYATAGYCNMDCTNTLLPEDGVNVVSVVLHSHMAGRKMSLKHIRKNNELPHIVKENRFDFDYQQSHTLKEEVKILPGDELITECVYGTQDRTKPTLGGYSAMQEMCLAFVVYYPRTELAGCYSMTPAKDLFKTLGVDNFKGVSLDNLDRMFLTTGTDAVSLPTNIQQQLAAYPTARATDGTDDRILKETENALRGAQEYSNDDTEDNVFARLVIEKPEEFRGRTLTEHLSALPWTEELLTKSIEESLYYGKHTTFCRKKDDKLALPIDTQLLPNFTKFADNNETMCLKMMTQSTSSSILSSNLIMIINLFIAVCIVYC